MPSPTLLRNFQPQAYYHVFNRGARKQLIFLKEKDFWVFRRYFNEASERFPSVRLVVFALLPNHFHFLLYQEGERDISLFMRSFIARYRRYVKEKYHISGPFFDSPYQSIYLKTSAKTEKVRKYILNNPIEAGLTDWPHVGSAME